MTAQDGGSRLSLNKIDIPNAALGTFAILIGVYVAIDASGYHDGSTYDGLGPSLLPYIIGAGLILTGLPILLKALRAGGSGEAFAQVDWKAVALIALALVLPIVFVVPLGWIPVITVVFALGARAFGSRRTIVDLGLGLAFGVVTFTVFNFGLGLHLPTGSLFARFFG